MALAKEYIALMHKDLNQKITEWVGFEWWEDGQLYTFGKDWLSRELPDFTTSLDALFKWVVPKVVNEGYLFIDVLFDDWLDVLGDDGAYALALCYAVEKLIDEPTT